MSTHHRRGWRRATIIAEQRRLFPEPAPDVYRYSRRVNKRWAARAALGYRRFATMVLGQHDWAMRSVLPLARLMARGRGGK